MGDKPEYKLFRLHNLIVCEGCLNGVGGECHTPGCSFWFNPAPDTWKPEKLQEVGVQIEDPAETLTDRYTDDEMRSELHHWIRISSNPNTYAMLDQLLRSSRRCAELEAEREKLVKWCEKRRQIYKEEHAWTQKWTLDDVLSALNGDMHMPEVEDEAE